MMLFGGCLTPLIDPEDVYVPVNEPADEHLVFVNPLPLPGVIRRTGGGALSARFCPHLRGCLLYLEIATEQGEHYLMQRLGVNHDDQWCVFAFSETHGLYIPAQFSIQEIAILRPNLSNLARLHRLIQCADHFFVADRRCWRAEFYEILHRAVSTA